MMRGLLKVTAFETLKERFRPHLLLLMKPWKTDFIPDEATDVPNTDSHSPSSGGHPEGKDSVTGPCSTVRPLGRLGWSGGCCWMLVAGRHPQRLEAQSIKNPGTHKHGRKEKTWMQNLVSLNSATSPLWGTSAIVSKIFCSLIFFSLILTQNKNGTF